jgi:hypothetical protein
LHWRRRREIAVIVRLSCVKPESNWGSPLWVSPFCCCKQIIRYGMQPIRHHYCPRRSSRTKISLVFCPLRSSRIKICLVFYPLRSSQTKIRLVYCPRRSSRIKIYIVYCPLRSSRTIIRLIYCPRRPTRTIIKIFWENLLSLCLISS